MTTCLLRCAVRCFIGAFLSLMLFTSTGAQEPEQVVARIRLNSPKNKENPVFAEAGDVLTVLERQEETVLVQTPSGRRGNVRAQDVIPLAQSRKLYDDLIQKEPKNASLYASRALVWSIANDKQKVISDLTKAIQLGLQTPSVYINRGAAYATSGEYDRAIADYDKAIEKGYDHPSVFINRAVAHFAKGDANKAAEDFTRALEKNPKDEFARMQRGVAYQRLGQWDKAIADFNALIKMDEQNVEAISSRGFTHYLKGDSKQAVEDFTRVIELNPQSALAYNNRGYNRQVIGQYEKALADFNKAIELDPDYALAYQNKAWLLATCPDADIRDGKRAIAAAKKAGELRDWKAITDIKSLAAAYAEVGEFDKAVQWQKKAVDMAEGEAKTAEQELLKLYQAEAPFRFAAPPGG